ncbi:peptidoglycan-associated lipoprotein [Luteibacter sp. UNCMF331Sha3.1]|uniref:OmpA family protein n=1 Tax=Luteibacter sp. UNCMF331Sha3.1 TaxID=1502760 RepID=UPI0008AC00BE|nr:OmpA family protein [Luteibacter sp. UNCMF331Sha3.1]SEN19529.1 peptidoglycan-associated lipoprotein [Luteibacter sp. UNCMF331Sha3.1]
MRCHRHPFVISSCLLMGALAGCHGYVKKADFDSTIAELRATDQKQQQEIDNLGEQMRQRFADYDVKIAQMKGRIRVDTAAHFAFNDATLRNEDKPLLDDFAKVVSGHFPEAVITVEGFADAAGSKAFNLRLARERAQTVRDYLISTGGLSGEKVRVVSYGEARNRQVLQDKWGDGAEPNRRVSLVVDDAGVPSASGG